MFAAVMPAAAQDVNSTVTIHSIKSAAEAFSSEGKFMVRRTGGTNFSQLIFYELSGSASNGVDYEQLGGTVEMPAGTVAVPFTVKPIDDSLIEGTETVVAQIKPSPLDCATCGYDIGEPDAAEVIIYDNDTKDTNAPPFIFFYSPANGATFTGPTNIIFRAYADDPEDRFFVQVEFFEGGKSLGFGRFQPATCPGPYCPYFDLVWSNVPPGEYTLTARARDSHGLISYSGPSMVSVRDSEPRNPPVLRILAQPRDTVSFWDCKAFFSVLVEVDPPETPILYQWQRNGINIPGATNSSYTTGYLTGADNDIPYRCRISAGETEVLSAEARVTIGGDVVLPHLRGAFRYSIDAIALAFNYSVNPGDPYNYDITPAVTIDSVETLSSDPAIILLRTAPLTVGSSYTVTVSDLQGLSGNVIHPNPSTTRVFIHGLVTASNRLHPFAAGPYLVIEWRGAGGMLQSSENPFGPWQDLSTNNPGVVLTRPDYCDATPRRPHQFFRLRELQ
jgi:hypothetical protein